MSDLYSYGGDHRVVVARAEIERITATLSTIQARLENELRPMAQLHGLVQHVQYDFELPELLVRLGLQRHGCFVASENYFGVEAKTAHQFSAIANFVNSNPWLKAAIPKSVEIGLGIGLVAAGFSNTNLTAHGVGALAASLPVGELETLSRNLPSEKVSVLEQPLAMVAAKPNSLATIAERLDNKSGNIRIESYQDARGRLLVVYLPGTKNWLPVGGDNAFDLRSDVDLLGNGKNSNSIRAANAALGAFGAKQTDRLILVGYSQGGMLAAELAEKHSNVVGLITLGSPIAQDSLPSDLPVISLEHSNDIVPAVSGSTNPITENWVTASRHVNLHPGQTVIDAHSMNYYQQTAALADESNESGLKRVRALILNQIAESTAVETKEYLPTKGASSP